MASINARLIRRNYQVDVVILITFAFEIYDLLDDDEYCTK